MGLNNIGVLVLIGIVNPWLLIPIAVLGVAFYFLKKFYLATYRDVKLLEAKSDIKLKSAHTDFSSTVCV